MKQKTSTTRFQTMSHAFGIIRPGLRMAPIALLVAMCGIGGASAQTDPVGDIELRVKVATLALQDGNLDVAAEAFENVLQLAPKNGPAHYNLAVIYQKQGEPGKSLNHLNEALKLKLPADVQSSAERLHVQLMYEIGKTRTAGKKGIRYLASSLGTVQDLGYAIGFAIGSWEMPDYGDSEISLRYQQTMSDDRLNFHETYVVPLGELLPDVQKLRTGGYFSLQVRCADGASCISKTWETRDGNARSSLRDLEFGFIDASSVQQAVEGLTAAVEAARQPALTSSSRPRAVAAFQEPVREPALEGEKEPASAISHPVRIRHYGKAGISQKAY